jgi:hypothetical protein
MFSNNNNNNNTIDDVQSSAPSFRVDHNDSPMEPSSIPSSNDGRSTLGKLAINMANLIAESSKQNNNTGSTDSCHISPDIELGLPRSPVRSSYADAIDAFDNFCHIAVRRGRKHIP